MVITSVGVISRWNAIEYWVWAGSLVSRRFWRGEKFRTAQRVGATLVVARVARFRGIHFNRSRKLNWQSRNRARAR
jgi:hypothetical protein